MRLAFLMTLLVSSATNFAKDYEPRAAYALQWVVTLPADSRGYGLRWTANGRATSRPADGLALRFVTVDPPTTNPFNADPNLYDRPPQHVEVYLDGVMIADRRTDRPLGLPATQPAIRPANILMALSLRFVTGGALLRVAADGHAVYDGLLIPGLQATDFRPAFDGAGVRDVAAEWSGEVLTPPAPPTVVIGLDRVLLDKNHKTTRRSVNFPTEVSPFGRVLCTFTLAATPAGLDKWDRVGSVDVVSDDGTRIELLRFVTPYNKAWSWQSDVTDLLPVLQGHRTLELHCDTYGPGWLTSVVFNFYPGPLSPRPFRVTGVWDTTVILGQADRPIDQQLPRTPLAIDPTAARVTLRTLVTGHGWSGNAGDAGEFLPLWREVHVGDAVFKNTLWKTDNDLNPCRPQGGTWKYDRAGWGPGCVVMPWTIDITSAMRATTRPTLAYEIQPYNNPTPNKDFPAQHRLSAQVIQWH